MEARNVVQYGNFLQMEIKITPSTDIYTTHTLRSQYTIRGVTLFEMKAIVARRTVNNDPKIALIFIKFTKIKKDDDLSYKLKLSSTDINITEMTFISDDGTWHLIKETGNRFNFVFTAVMDILPHTSSFSIFHEDTVFNDFELRGEDGSVNIHRAVLAASSPVLGRMLGSTWRETTEGYLDVQGTSRVTLQHLKDYMYLHKLPEMEFEQLLLLASYYMMPVLEQKCVDKLMNSLTAQNAFLLLEFGMKHKVTSLLQAILEWIRSAKVNLNDVVEHFRMKN